jgi:DNA-binding beta-propeller fold protein YncE
MNPVSSQSHLRKTVIVLILTTIAGFLVLGSGCEQPVDNEIGPGIPYASQLYIVGDNTLQILGPDLETRQDPIGVGLGANQILLMEGGLYVINSISHTLQRISFSNSTYQTTGSVDLGLDRNTSPFAAVRLGNRRVAVSNLLANSISVIDVINMEIVNEHPVGRAPEGLLYLYDQDTLFVINSGYDFSDFSFHSGSIYKISSESGEIIDSLKLGTNPQYGLTVQDKLHVSCTGNYQDFNGEIWILNTDPLEIEHIIEIGHSPGRMTLDRWDNIVYVAAGGWSNEGESEGLILSYNSDTYETLDPLSASLGVVDVVWNEANTYLYAACRDAMKLDVFDGHERIASHSLEDPPNAIAVEVSQ